MTPTDWSYFDEATGLFTGARAHGTRRAALLNAPSGCRVLQGLYDPEISRVDLATGEVVAYLPPRPADDEWQTWSLVDGRWHATPTEAAIWRDIRAQRDHLLASCDWVRIRADDLGEPVPAPWAAYRQALRDITLQSLPVVWPDRPE